MGNKPNKDTRTQDTRQKADIIPPPTGRHVPRHNSTTGALWRPLRTHTDRIQDGDLQSGTDRWRPRRSWELWRPWQVVLVASSLGPATTAGALLPPPPQKKKKRKKRTKSMGWLRGYQAPSRAWGKNRKPS